MLRIFVTKVYINYTPLLSRCIGVKFMSSATDATKSGSDSDWSSSDSEETLNNSEEVDNNKKQILKAALSYVPQHGWTKQSIALGAENVGLPGTIHGLFERGPVELVEFFNRSANEQLTELMSAEPTESKQKTKIFLQNAVSTRLKMLIPYIHHWPQAMAMMAMPANAASSFKIISHMIDDMWYYAGDRSTYMSWYTKRGSLAAVYASTELYMLQDKSAEYQETWNFLQRQVSTLSQFGECVQQCQNISNASEDFLYAAMHVARNMVSMNIRHR